MAADEDARDAAAIIAALGLLPHPEGGHFRETWRDLRLDGTRGHGTAIYYLLAAREISHWHRVDAVEIWHYYAGAPLELRMASESAKPITTHLLGPDVLRNERPQLIVPKGFWQSARSLGDWTLVGCTVSPAFEFSGFEMAPPNWQP
jgi:hypothetical protein